MKRFVIWIIILTLCAAARADAGYGAYAPAKDAALAALAGRLAAEKECVYVYRDFADTANHFTQKALMTGYGIGTVCDMDEDCRISPYTGSSCIRCEQITAEGDWGGWLFLNGYLPEGETEPRLNDGTGPDQGLDLSGAKELRFMARGEEGGEVVEFFTAGFGYDGEWGTATVDYPDSSPKRSAGFVKLTNEWQEYVIPLDGADMSSIVCGFGYVLSGGLSGNRDNVFYLDDIRFTGDMAKGAPVLLRSYDTDNIYIRNAAFSYDNALAAMAFLSEGREEEARELLDAFVFAVENDRHAPGRVRNAYAAGDISSFPDWGGTARLPGWYDTEAGEHGSWYEDRYQTGSNVGNTSYVALAMLQYNAIYGTDRYLGTARRLMDWVIDTCTDATQGFTAGFDGWAEGETPVVYPFTYKSIEHNIDAYAAFRQLYAVTGEEKYRAAAESALALVTGMYDEKEGVFYTGTLDDGVTPSTDNIVLDAQVWACLALGEDFAPFERSLERVRAMRTAEGGYPFSAGYTDAYWCEGTAYTALMHRLRGEDAEALAALGALERVRQESGLFPAATAKELPTGFGLFDGTMWVYSDDPHIAPAAWFVMAVNGFDPYLFDGARP